MRNYLIQEIECERKLGKSEAFMLSSMEDYMNLAKFYIRKLGGNRSTSLLYSEDVVGFFAHKMMMADWQYDESTGCAISTYRDRTAQFAMKNIFRCLMGGSHGEIVQIVDPTEDTAYLSVESTNQSRHSDTLDEIYRRLTPRERAYVMTKYIGGGTIMEAEEVSGIDKQQVRRKLAVLREECTMY